MLATSVFSFPFKIVLSLHFSSRAWVPKVIQHYLYTSGSFICDFQSEVFAVAFALLAAVAVILTLNVSSPRRSICGFKKVSILWHNPLNSLMGDAFEFTFLLIFTPFVLCIAVNPHISHCVQASYQGGFNIFHKLFWCHSEQSERLSFVDLTQSSNCVPPSKYVSLDSWRLSLCLWSSLYQIYDCPL